MPPSVEVVERRAGKCRKSLTDIEVVVFFTRMGKIWHRKKMLLECIQYTHKLKFNTMIFFFYKLLYVA